MKYCKYLLFIFLCFVFVNNVNAQVKLGGTILSSNNFVVLNTGNRIIDFGSENVSSYDNWKNYFLITLCTDSNNITNWYINDNTLNQINFTNTNYSCMFPNSTYTGGHIVYVIGNTKFDYGCGVGTSCINGGKATLYVPNNSSWALLDESYSKSPISIDYASMSIVSNDKTIINQNQTIINQNTEIKNSINDVNNSINNSDTSGATNDAGNFFSGFETDTFGLTSIITSPLNLIGSITNGSCSQLGLPLPFVNETIYLPCLSTIYSQYFGDFLTIYQLVTFGIVAYWVCVRIFNLVKDFKNPDHDEIEVLDL